MSGTINKINLKNLVNNNDNNNTFQINNYFLVTEQFVKRDEQKNKKVIFMHTKSYFILFLFPKIKQKND